VQFFPKIEIENWRLVVLRSNTRELLLMEGERGTSLPRVETPKGSRVARELTERVRSVWNLEVFSLRELASTEPYRRDGARSFALETIHPNADAPENGRWSDVSRIAVCRLIEEDRAVVETWLRQAAEVRSNGVRQRIGDPGTFQRIRAWVQQVLANSGRTLGAEFQQMNAAEDFSLVRFATDRGAVWFKAVGEPNVREFSLTVTLADLFPEHTPPILATEPLWNAWLAPEIPGRRLSERGDLAAWSRAARDLASLQVGSSEKTEAILRCSAHDLRCSVLQGSIRSFFARLAQFMMRPSLSQPAPLSRAELVDLEGAVRRTLCDLQAEGWPHTLVHADLNPDNLIALPNGTVFLDWAEASVGPPFLSLAFLLEYFHSHFPDEVPAPLIKAYADVWQTKKCFENVERTLCRAALVAILAHAVSTDAWQEGSTRNTPRMEGYYRSLARRMKSYADRIEEGAATVADLWN